jgi:acetylglutamate kinase
MKPSRVVIKLGGAALKDEAVLDVVTEAVKQYRKYDYQVVLVHGGGPAINTELTARGISWNFLDGQRVTTPEMMDVIESTLCGKVNGQLVRHLGSHGLPSLGFSGTDGNTLVCTAASKELGRVGKIEKVNVGWLEGVLSMAQTPVPVISPIGVGLGGESYNINADWAASHLAVALQARYLVFLTDQNGILNQGRQLVKKLSPWDLEQMIQTGVVKDGMSTKARAMLHALENGVSSVRVMNGMDAINGLWSNFVGTWCATETELPVFSSGMDEVNYATA